MTETHELKIPFADASRIEIVCQRCKGALVIDLAQKEQVKHFVPVDNETPRPFHCPLCQTDFDSSIKFAINKLRSAFVILGDAGHFISFCVKAGTTVK